MGFININNSTTICLSEFRISFLDKSNTFKLSCFNKGNCSVLHSLKVIEGADNVVKGSMANLETKVLKNFTMI